MVKLNQEVVSNNVKPNGADLAQTSSAKPSATQLKYLKMGVNQAGCKLPLFDAEGQEIKPATIRSCIEKGWAEPWFNNPIKPNWLVCKLTEAGKKAIS
jgi:hypothetical protein